MAFLTGKSVLVTGGVGTIGRELVHQILDQQPRDLRVIDVNESEIFFLEQELDQRLANEGRTASHCHCYVGDVRDRDRLTQLMEGIDVVFHVAAYKHVILCERSPFEAVQTNIIGVKNVIYAALSNDVARVIFTSSDKAVNPTNVMGTSKLMGERLITAANSIKVNGRTIFSSTRFGNVLGSRGSVIPIFYRQIQAGGPVTLTHPDMTRFVMTREESCRLLLLGAELARGGEVFVTKMPVMRIEDVAAVMIEMLAPKFGYSAKTIQITEIGVKPGEKIYEELMSEEEMHRTVELQEMFAVLPAFRSVYEKIDYDYPGIVRSQVYDPYISSKKQPLDRDSIRAYFETHHILDSLDSNSADHNGQRTLQIKHAA